MELFWSLNPVADTHSPCYKLQPGQGLLWALCLADPPGLGAGGLSQQEAAAKPENISLKFINIHTYIYKSDMKREMTKENSQAGDQTCSIDAFMETGFILLTTRYLPKEENVVLDGWLVSALDWSYLHPHGTTCYPHKCFLQKWWQKLLESSAGSTQLNALWGKDSCCLWGLSNEGWSRKTLPSSSSRYDSHEGSEHCTTRLVHCHWVWNLLTACGCLYQPVWSIKKTCKSPTLFFYCTA